MKKTFTLIFLILPFFVLSQNSFPIVKEGAVYREGVGYLVNPPNQFEYEKKQFLMNGDTVMFGKTYKKLYETNYDSIINSKIYIGAIRQDSASRVYFVKDSSFRFFTFFPPEFTQDKEVLLYDLGAGIGDTVIIPNNVDSFNIISGADSVLINGEYRQRLQVNTQALMGQVYWIEGIGSSKGLFSPALDEFEWNFRLNCYEDQNIFWNNPELSGESCFTVSTSEEKRSPTVQIYPNPASSHIIIEIEAESERAVDIYNLGGQLILSKELANNQVRISVSGWNPGLYFLRINTVNGIVTRKVVVRK